jgi:hypothetical protein
MVAHTLTAERPKNKELQPGRPHSLLSDTKAIKKQISDWLFDEVKGVVQSGPFEGMQLVRETAWDDYLSPFLLGCYEEELHGEFERQIRRLKKLGRPPKISVVGCAEGYYAIGLKRRIPEAHVFIVDKDPKALHICGEAAAANGVELVVNAPVGVYLDCDLLVMDVEGSEIAYLDPDLCANLLHTHVIVEIHDWPDPKTNERISEILLNRFRGSHHIVLMLEGGRNPNKYSVLCHMTSDYRWLAVSEGRPTLMGWYVMEPKGAYMS